MLKEDIVIGKKYRWHAGHSPSDDDYPDMAILSDGVSVKVIDVSSNPGRKFPVHVVDKFGRRDVVAPQELSELD